MLEQHFRSIIDRPLTSLAKTININPDTITITGFIVTVIAALTIPENLFLGGVLILIGGFFDMFDGISARVNNRRTKFGAFLDSVLDRYSDSFLLLGFACYFIKTDSMTGLWLSLGTLVGALLTSYVRARAEGLGADCKVGLMERPERVLLMVFGAITGLALFIMWILFILTHVTVIQRIYHVWKVMKQP